MTQNNNFTYNIPRVSLNPWYTRHDVLQNEGRRYYWQKFVIDVCLFVCLFDLHRIFQSFQTRACSVVLSLGEWTFYCVQVENWFQNSWILNHYFHTLRYCFVSLEKAFNSGRNKFLIWQMIGLETKEWEMERKHVGSHPTLTKRK